MEDQQPSSAVPVQQDTEESNRINEEAFQEVFRVLNDRYLNDAILSKYRQEVSRTNVECYNRVDLMDLRDSFDQESLADEQDQGEAMTSTGSGSGSALEKGEQQGSDTSDEGWESLSSEDDVYSDTEAKIKEQCEGKGKGTPAEFKQYEVFRCKQYAKCVEIDVDEELRKAKMSKTPPAFQSMKRFFFDKYYQALPAQNLGLNHH